MKGAESTRHLDPPARAAAGPPPGTPEGGALQRLAERADGAARLGPRRDGGRASLLRRELDRRRRRRPDRDRALRLDGRRVRHGPGADRRWRKLLADEYVEEASERVEKRFQAIGNQILNRTSAGGSMQQDPIGSVLGDPEKRRAAAIILGQAYIKAHALVEHNRGAVERVADVLVARKEIHGDEVIDLLDSLRFEIPKVDLLDEERGRSSEPEQRARGQRPAGGTPTPPPGEPPAFLAKREEPELLGDAPTPCAGPAAPHRLPARLPDPRHRHRRPIIGFGALMMTGAVVDEAGAGRPGSRRQRLRARPRDRRPRLAGLPAAERQQLVARYPALADRLSTHQSSRQRSTRRRSLAGSSRSRPSRATTRSCTSLCGTGEQCSIAEGQPTLERHRLLRREALELALTVPLRRRRRRSRDVPAAAAQRCRSRATATSRKRSSDQRCTSARQTEAAVRPPLPPRSVAHRSASRCRGSRHAGRPAHAPGILPLFVPAHPGRPSTILVLSPLQG